MVLNDISIEKPVGGCVPVFQQLYWFPCLCRTDVQKNWSTGGPLRSNARFNKRPGVGRVCHGCCTPSQICSKTLAREPGSLRTCKMCSWKRLGVSRGSKVGKEKKRKQSKKRIRSENTP